MGAIIGVIQMIGAASTGTKAIFTLKKPPPGSKTATFNVAGVIAWVVAYYGLDLEPEVLNAVSVVVLAVGNLILRKLTVGPLPGK